MQFYARLRILTDGVLHVRPDTLSVSEASEAIFLLAADTNFLSPFALDDTDAFRINVSQTLARAASKGFETLKDAHIADYRALFSTTRLTFFGSSRDFLPTDERLAAFGKNHADVGLMRSCLTMANTSPSAVRAREPKPLTCKACGTKA